MKYVFAILLSIYINISYAKPAWTDVKVLEFGSIKIPDTMEIQSKFLGGLVNKMSEHIDAVIEGDRVTIQQLGVNDQNSEALSHFVRFIVITQYGNAGDYFKLSDPINITKNILASFNNEVKNTIKNEYSKFNLVIHHWNQASLQKIGTYNAIKFNYERSILSNEPVTVEKYWIPNNDRMHTIEVQYRTKEKALWMPFLHEMKNSIYIIQH